MLFGLLQTLKRDKNDLGKTFGDVEDSQKGRNQEKLSMCEREFLHVSSGKKIAFVERTLYMLLPSHTAGLVVSSSMGFIFRNLMEIIVFSVVCA